MNHIRTLLLVPALILGSCVREPQVGIDEEGADALLGQCNAQVGRAGGLPVLGQRAREDDGLRRLVRIGEGEVGA